ncbi:16S rRNA (cytosine(1402)-N(4))-methyltransferase RsmH [Corynebacterium pyruviciproducens]
MYFPDIRTDPHSGRALYALNYHRHVHRLTGKGGEWRVDNYSDVKQHREENDRFADHHADRVPPRSGTDEPSVLEPSLTADTARVQRSFDLSANHGHVPVMRDRMIELVGIGIDAAESTGIVVDATLGAGGHTEYLLATNPRARVIGVDRDAQALAGATDRLSQFGDRFVGLNVRFDQWVEAATVSTHPLCVEASRNGIAGALFDLGVSSMQLDQEERGFAYKVDAPLDMRMDPSKGITAAEILNTYSHGDLARILKKYGDEKFAGKIASAIIREREKEPFARSGRLVELLYETIPAPARRHGGHPAKRTFQALRVEVNQELKALEQVIPITAEALHVGGVMAFMSYQSLEDKIVKRALGELTTSTNPPGLPVDLPGTKPHFRLLTRGAEKASPEEIEQNSRAASVRVRAAQRTLNGERS